MPKKPQPRSFKARHNRETVVVNKIRDALAALEKEEGPTGFAYESSDPDGRPTFQKRAGVSQLDLAQFRARFMDHIVELNEAGYVVRTPASSRERVKRVWFATAKEAKANRG